MYLTKGLINENPIREYKIGSINFIIKNNFTQDVSVKEVIELLKDLPTSLLNMARTIFVGDFVFLKKRQVDAIYDNNTVYISNNIRSLQDFMKNLIHELAHACEHKYYKDIYEDGLIKQEFLSKREKLYDILASYEYSQLSKDYFLNPEYNKQFDAFLYKTVGYSKLDTFVNGIFLSPYAATSLREYFANGFEKYFLESTQEVSKISPSLHQKLSLFKV